MAAPVATRNPEPEDPKDTLLRAVVGCATAPIAVAFAVVIVAPLILYSAYAAQLLWGWFITPNFGTPEPRLLALAGILLTVKFIVTGAGKDNEKKDEPFWESIKRLLMRPIVRITVTILIGYLIYRADLYVG